MQKKSETDVNDYTTVRGVPITKSGVFMYSGKSLGFEGLEENKLYPVLRPEEELNKMVKNWQESGDKPIPFIEDHTLLNRNAPDAVNYEDKPAQGVLFALKSIKDAIIGDITLFSRKIRDTIKSGKRELSLGYACSYERKEGVFKGKIYQFIQRNLVPNHLALVDEGRMGHSVALALDAKEANFAYDAVEIDFSKEESTPNKGNGDMSDDKGKIQEASDEFIDVALLKKKFPNDIDWIEKNKYQRRVKTEDEQVVVPTKTSRTGFITTNKETKDNDMDENKDKSVAKDEDVDKRDLIREIMAIAAKSNDDFEGGEKEKIETIAKKLEEVAYNKSSAGTANDDEPKKDGEGDEGEPKKDEGEPKEKKEGEDEDEPKKDEPEKKEGEAEDGCGKDDKDDKVAMDASEIRKSVIATLRKMDNFAKEVFPVCGAFAYDAMESVEQMAEEACKRLKLETRGNALATIGGYLAAKPSKTSKSVLEFTFDHNEPKSEATVQDRLKSIIK